MKVVMIHGINQQDSTQVQLLKKWKDLVHGKAPGLFDKHDLSMAYYGTTLSDWTKGSAAIKMGPHDIHFDPGNNAELDFLVAALEEAARKNKISEQAIAAAADEAADHEAVPMGTWLGRRLVGLVRALEKISPAKGAVVLKVIKQAHTYLAAPGAGPAVDALVKPHLTGKEVVIISHSLGTVIAFKLLREMAATGTRVPLFITMGSPLGLESVQSKLGPSFEKPAIVSRWENFYDPADFVSLGKELKSELDTDIIDDGTVDNTTSNAHGISGYLPHSKVVAALKSIL
ncbi:hypothetical protein DSM25558_3200 [Agrobacterium sp. DSM 25558]|uniref:hypothetical protein n=1 Tax=Agrobacterium sp. DSM 25558 TaxID=1907665 RepID=UPI0009724C9E|nr:hypothetical protein [Agrobacterium sp. DSM 25558]SCX22710.1 hypothetical protein DSM25558_3200 [Agrobacterium sp. DSM 25558]